MKHLKRFNSLFRMHKAKQVPDARTQELSQRRYEIVPQMHYYDDCLAMDYVPYLMSFHRPAIRTPYFSTDENGFRHTPARSRSNRTGIVVGGSVAFGLGAGGDGETIAGQLADLTGFQWLNYGGCAFNAYQELFLFQLFPPPRVSHIVIVSGLNTVYVNHIDSPHWRNVPNFYYMKAHAARLGLDNSDPLTPFGAAPTRALDRCIAVAKSVAELTNTLSVWAALAQQRSASLMFVFQPLANGIGKTLSEEEVELFSILDQLEAPALEEYLSATYSAFSEVRSDVAKHARSLGIVCADSNEWSELTAPEWLFVDRVHMTDKGNRAISHRILETMP